CARAIYDGYYRFDYW
nr:immunoglobulin heavy chain junction region [Mus musculus]MBK4196604.1 immunoglobulin heavy chain junction region [Mus musculus]MBK4196605.1 immunoglobulin heavy chain junction region [Mus musculus]